MPHRTLIVPTAAMAAMHPECYAARSSIQPHACDMTSSRQTRFDDIAATLGYRFDGEIKVGGHYVPVMRNDSEVYVSGQIPRVDNAVVVTGRAGADVSLADAQCAAQVCVMRALALLAREAGSLDCIRRILRITVYVQCAADFTLQSEVADGASDVLHAVLGDAGRHTRTSVGVYQLPKNATVELDLVAVLEDAGKPR